MGERELMGQVGGRIPLQRMVSVSSGGLTASDATRCTAEATSEDAAESGSRTL